ncbi:hypothetical protein L1987_71217 [Smallanthus sonchifolius]|uniref:Uncharacterized protein n=1 Tax=Smallanthus sonchifolius TaxID=185202 RepID=A0ACB9ARU0_9ASTR|nr:hypothetical protein L1987_71217 [Smallanthus sonchifolius]
MKNKKTRMMIKTHYTWLYSDSHIIITHLLFLKWPCGWLLFGPPGTESPMSIQGTTRMIKASFISEYCLSLSEVESGITVIKHCLGNLPFYMA